MKTNDFSYFIERYNAGEMNETERLWFLREAEGNPALRREADLRRKTDEALRRKDIIKLREKLLVIESKVKAGKSHRRPWSEFARYAAVFAGILVIAGGLLLIPKAGMSGNEIIEKYYSPYGPPSASRSGTSVSNADYNLAIEYYKVKDYRNAAALFSKVVENEPRNMNSWLLNGISNFEISNYPEARNSFTKVVDDNNNLYIDHAQWYLALCYVRTGEMDKARQKLSEIVNSRNIHARDARKILKELK